MICSACGTTNRDDRRFCAQCGVPLSTSCAHCGFKNEPNEKFCGGCGKPTALLPASAPAPSAPAEKSQANLRAVEIRGDRRAAPERRQITVLFCDLVGSTALSERLDPEVLREVICAYQQTAAEVIGRYEGHIAQYLGDGILVYFGYPRAHEDDAQRAVRAAIEVIEAVKRLGPPVKNAEELRLAVRIGIDSGAVVVGEIGGDANFPLALGETPNVAARLQGVAEPNTVVVGENTHRLIEGLYVCDDLGPQSLKGVSHPARAFRVLHESETHSRFEVKALRGLVPLIGREEEVELLYKRWQQSADGEGQAILLSGESGVGKSRIVLGFKDRLKDDAENRVLYFCSPYHRDTPYYPVIDQLERILHFAKHDTPEQKLDKLETVMSGLGLTLAKVIPPLASLLALSVGTRYPAVALDGEGRKKRTLEAILLVLEAMTKRGPVLMVVEDLHWVDLSTMELLKLITEWLASKRVLLLATHRLEFVPTWNTLSHITAIKLSRLSRKASTELIVKVTGGKTLPDEVLEHILARTDGIPLFVEELTKTVLESGLLKDAGDRYVLSGPLPPKAIPTSLQDSLMARLDRLAPVKEMAQLAATLGRQFSQDVLAAVSRVAEISLDVALHQLVEAELVYRRGLAPSVIFEFKHALVQEVAYNSLLRSKRQQLHVEIASIMEEQFAETVAAQPELLSHHYQSAGLPARAIPYSLRAGDVAVSRYASAEAAVHYQAALDMADGQTPSDDVASARIQATLKLASVATKRDQFERNLQNLERARQLAEQVNSREQLCRILYWIGRMNFVLGSFEQGVVYAEQSLRVAETLGNDDTLTAEPVNLLARIHCLQGEPAKATTYAARNVGQMHKVGNRIEEAAVSGVLAFAQGLHGNYREAIDAADHGVAMAKGLEHLPTMAACYMYRAVVKGWFGRLPEAVADFEQSLAVSERAGDVFRRYLVHGWRGEAYVLSDNFAAAEQELSQCIALGSQIGTSFHRGAFLAFAAKVSLHNGEVEEARRAAEEAVKVAVETSQPWAHSIALRVLAETLLAGAPENVETAEKMARTAIEIQEQRQCRCDLAWSRLILGQALQAKGERDAATAEFARAKRDFEQLDIARGMQKVASALDCPDVVAPMQLWRNKL